MIQFLSQLHLVIAVFPMFAAGLLACAGGFVYVWYERRAERLAQGKADGEGSTGDSRKKTQSRARLMSRAD